MDQATMAVLTGLLGVVLGCVLIGGTLVAAFLIGRERGRREALEGEYGASHEADTQLLDLERRHHALQEEVQLLAARLAPRAPVNPCITVSTSCRDVSFGRICRFLIGGGWVAAPWAAPRAGSRVTAETASAGTTKRLKRIINTLSTQASYDRPEIGRS